MDQEICLITYQFFLEYHLTLKYCLGLLMINEKFNKTYSAGFKFGYMLEIVRSQFIIV